MQKLLFGLSILILVSCTYEKGEEPTPVVNTPTPTPTDTTSSCDSTVLKTVMIHATVNYTFSPDSINVTRGDTIKFIWDSGGDIHSTTSDAIPATAPTWDHPLSSSDQQFIYIVKKPGRYSYHCTPHWADNMKGVFIASERECK